MKFLRIFGYVPGILVFSFIPYIAHAEEIDSLSDIGRFFSIVQQILDILIPLLITLAVLVFFWGLVKYIYSAGDPKQRDAGKGLMVWGVITLFVMVSIWGFTELLSSLFGIDSNAGVTIPSVPSP